MPSALAMQCMGVRLINTSQVVLFSFKLKDRWLSSIWYQTVLMINICMIPNMHDGYEHSAFIAIHVKEKIGYI
jgi:hypothetical protein